MRAFACPVCREFTAFESDRCTTCQTSLGLHLPSKSMVALVDGASVIDGQAGMVLLADKVRFAASRDIVPLESYADHPIERILFDWRWMSMFFNRVTTARGKGPLYPFEIPPAVVDKLGFVHQVVRDTARRGEH